MTARDAEPTKAVIDGVLQYVSPSQITTADPQSYGGCFRRWWFEKVRGVEKVETEAQRIGKLVHAQLEHYLKTGEDVRGTIARRAAPWMPEGPYPRPSLAVEHPIAAVRDDGSVEGALKIAGMPVLGYIDVVDVGRPIIRITDWKTTGKVENAKKQHEVADTVQMACYGEWGFLEFPSTPRLELGHVALSTKNSDAAAAFDVVDRERTSRRLKLAEPVVATIKDLARETDPARAPANPTACGAYGGCPHITYCPRTAADTLASIVGRTAAMSLTQAITPPAGVGVTINALAAQATPQYPPGVDPAFADAIATISAVGQALNKGFPAIGGTAAAAYAQLRGLPPAAGYAGYAPPGESENFGQLTITDVQQAIKMADSMSTHFKVPAVRWGGAPAAAPPAPPAPPAWAVPPTPPAPTLVVTQNTPVAAVQAADRVALPDGTIIKDRNGPHGCVDPTIAAGLPPDAPASNPALAAKPVEGWAPPVAPGVAVPLVAPGPAYLPPMAVPTPPGPVAAPPPEAPKKRGRPPKAKPEAAPAQPASAYAPPPGTTVIDVATTQQEARFMEIDDLSSMVGPVSISGGLEASDLDLWVDCMPAGDALVPFAPVVARLVDTIHHAFQVEDMRSAPTEGPLGFGRWKGILASMTREAVAKGTIAAVGYYADSRGDFAAVVIEALEKHVVARGVR